MRKGQNKIILTDEFLKEKGHTQESYAKLSRGAKWSKPNLEPSEDWQADANKLNILKDQAIFM